MVVIGWVGLGKMGLGMVKRLLKAGHTVYGYDLRRVVIRSPRFRYFSSLDDLVNSLPKPKKLWLMVPGEEVDSVLNNLCLPRGSVVVDGGNSFYESSQKRCRALARSGVNFLDVGVSGGVDGEKVGYCLMVGGKREVYNKFSLVFKSLGFFDYCGNSGAGHFVKMVHNGVEYGMMQALSEGVDLLEKSRKKFGYVTKDVVGIYSKNSVLSGNLVSWLVEVMGNKDYSKVPDVVPKGFTEAEMKRMSRLFGLPGLAVAVKQREVSRKSGGGRVITALRRRFGGHLVK